MCVCGESKVRRSLQISDESVAVWLGTAGFSLRATCSTSESEKKNKY